ncbi:hypothetical protein [Sandaracinus amylolyticus]|uniref:hypothetical protein n=1 Tax=Sandaracinus amylolyticus TaxID=927083 RepID=UPI00069CC575|nr:hypothetical protein [Sandaracinus amylolyticus]
MADTLEELTHELVEAERELHMLEPLRDEATDAYERAQRRVDDAYAAFSAAVRDEQPPGHIPTHDDEFQLVFSERWPVDDFSSPEDDGERHLSGDGGTIVVEPERSPLPGGAGSEQPGADVAGTADTAAAAATGTLPAAWVVPEIHASPNAPSPTEPEITTPIVLVTYSPPAPPGANEWRRRGPPRRGETLQGFPIQSDGGAPYVQLGSRQYKITRSRGGTWGLQYTSDSGEAALAREIERWVGIYLARGQLYRAVAARAFTVAAGHEGCVSAINTYDDQFLTIGAGFAGGRMQSMLRRIGQRSPTAAAFREIRPYFNERCEFVANDANKRTIRFDVVAIDKIVQIAESPQGARELGRCEVEEWVEGSALPERPNDVVANEAARSVRPEVLGIAAYCKHGRSGFTPNPPADLLTARRIGGEDPTRQVAVIVKLHLQRIADCRVEPGEDVPPAAPAARPVPDGETDRQRRARQQADRRASAAHTQRVRTFEADIERERGLYQSQPGPALTRRMPNKFTRFESAMREAGFRGFTFNAASVQDIIPGVRHPPRETERLLETWAPPRDSAPDDGQVYVEYNSHFYCFGPRIS